MGEDAGEADESPNGSLSPGQEMARRLEVPPIVIQTATRRLGAYELLQELARGGMGLVYRARHLELQRTVALKVISANGLSSAEFMARFHTEAKAAASLDHPNIVPVYEFGDCEGLHYLCMKFIDGENLAQRIACPNARLTSEHAARIMAKLAHAVHYAHQRGVIHRDLKPSNVLLDAAGEPYLTDFGLAKLIEGDSALTHTLAVLGTPAYMSPEQASGNTKNLTTAVDVYGLGAVMYELLAGEPPFAGGTAIQTIRQILDKEPRPLSSRNPRIPRDLEVICLKCLEKDPSRRYRSAEALAEDLERWIRNEPISARASTLFERAQKWVLRNPFLALLAGVTLSACLTLFVGMTVMSLRLAAANKSITAKAEESRRRLVRFNVAIGNRGLREMDYLRALPWFVDALRLEQGDAAREAIHRLRIQAALHYAPRLEQMVFHSDRVQAVQFSPDGSRLLTASADRTARLWSLASGGPVTPALLHDAPVSAAEFSPDGRCVATLAFDGVARIWDAAQGQSLTPPLRQLDFRPVSDRYGGVVWFSPDGRRLLTAYGSLHAHVWDSQTGNLVRSLPHPDVVYGAAFHPDGSRVATACADGNARVWNMASGALEGPMLPSLAGPAAWASFSPEGTRLLTVADRRTVQVWDWLHSRGLGAPISHSNALNVLFVAAFSPEGSRILTSSWDSTARIWSSATGEMLMRLNHDAGVLDAEFSKDGRRVATASWDGMARVWDAATGLPLASAMPQGSSLLRVALSPDGLRLAAASVNGAVRVWNLQPDHSRSMRLPHAGSAWAEFSPDQKWIVTASGQREGGIRIWDGENGAPLTPLLLPKIPVTQAVFSPNGRRLLTVSRDQTVRIWKGDDWKECVRPMAHSRPVRAASFSPDGKRVLTVCGDAARLWDAVRGEVVLPRLFDGEPVLSAEFSPDGHLLVTASADGRARLWSVATGEPAADPLPHRGEVRRAIFSPDGRTLATVSAVGNSRSGCVRLWDVGTGRASTPEILHPARVNDATFSLDGRRFATACGDAMARIWHARTGVASAPSLWHPAPVKQVLFSPDGHWLASASEDGSVLLWDAATGELAAPPFYDPTEHDLIRLAFSPDGRKLLIARCREAVWVEDLSRTNQSLEDLNLEAQVLSAHRVDPVAGQVSLDLSNLKSAWQKIRLMQRRAEVP